MEILNESRKFENFELLILIWGNSVLLMIAKEFVDESTAFELDSAVLIRKTQKFRRSKFTYKYFPQSFLNFFFSNNLWDRNVETI